LSPRRRDPPRRPDRQDHDTPRFSWATNALALSDDTPYLTVMEMLPRRRRLTARHGDLRLLVVAWLPTSTAGRGENRQVEDGRVLRGLKALARDLDVPDGDVVPEHHRRARFRSTATLRNDD